jgi:hypothetical protein
LSVRTRNCFAHALGLPVRPRVVGLREPVLDAQQAAHAVERVQPPADPVPPRLGELDPVVREHSVNAVRERLREHLEERRGDEPGRSPVDASESEFGGAVHRDEQVRFLARSAHLGDVEVEVADLVRGELPAPLLRGTGES